jgi:glycerol 3-phosphatase-1
VEGRIPREYGSDAVEVPGARLLLEALDKAGAPWAVVTSGTRALLEGWLEVLQLSHPKNLVVAEDVEVGKPDPRCYLLGRSRLGLGDDAAMLVIEDAPSGIKAGKAAGFMVLGLATTHKIDQLKEAGADWIIEDLRSLILKSCNGKVEVEILNALQ